MGETRGSAELRISAFISATNFLGCAVKDIGGEKNATGWVVRNTHGRFGALRLPLSALPSWGVIRKKFKPPPLANRST